MTELIRGTTRPPKAYLATAVEAALSAAELRVLLALAIDGFGWGEESEAVPSGNPGRLWGPGNPPTLERLAAFCRVSPSQVARATKRLAELGFLEISGGSGHVAKTYRLLPNVRMGAQVGVGTHAQVGAPQLGRPRQGSSRHIGRSISNESTLPSPPQETETGRGDIRPDAMDVALERARELEEGFAGMLGRSLSAGERLIILELAEARRDGALVGVSEILGYGLERLNTPTKDGTLPRTLNYVHGDLRSLVRMGWRDQRRAAARSTHSRVDARSARIQALLGNHDDDDLPWGRSPGEIHRVTVLDGYGAGEGLTRPARRLPAAEAS